MKRRARTITSFVVAIAVATGLSQAVAFVEAPGGSPALASAAQGSGGQFVPVTGRVLDTRPSYKIGPYSTPMQAGVWRTVTVAGMSMSDGSQLPSDMSAVAVTFSVIGPAASGYLNADKDEATPNATITYMHYLAGDNQSNTGILAVSAGGKIQVRSSQNTDLVIDVQGYYTSDDTVAPGGYVPVTPKRLVDTRNGTGLPQAKLAGGSTSTITVAGSASGVPTTASAAMLIITTLNDTSTTNHFYVPYPADEDRPANVAMSFAIGDRDASTSQVELSSKGSPLGAIKLFLSGTNSYSVDVTVDVAGYFAAGVSTGAFTPAAARVYDSKATGNTVIAAGATATIQVAGVKGVPLAGSGLSAVATHLSVQDHGTGGGFVEMWASGKPRPGPYNSLISAPNNTISNLVTSELGANGAVSLYNSGPDTIDVIVDVEGWYSSVGSAITNGQTFTQQSVTLQADPTASGSWVTYQYRVGTVDTFTNVPVANVKDKDANAPSSWPNQKTSGAFTAYAWNIRDTLAALTANNGVAPDALVQAQACFGTSSTDPSPVCGMPTNIDFAQDDGGDASSDVGPGSLSELTGDFQLSETDADATTSLGSLSVGRTLTTLRPAAAITAADGVFGPGWTADLTGPSSGAADLAVADNADKGYVLLTGSDGTVETYQATSTGTAYPLAFAPTGDDAGDNTLLTKTDASTITLSEADGAVTTWKKSGSGSTAVWAADSVKEPGSNATTSFTYGAGSTAGLVTRILAPVPSGVSSCSTPDTTPGCRSLILNYGPTTYDPANPDAAGPNKACKNTVSISGRLASIDISVPQSSGAANRVTTACFSYDSSGRLASTWDPRLPTPLKTGYTYTSANRLSTLTPPGLAPWTLAYDSTGRLQTVSRPDPSGSTATTTVVYDVPITPGSNAARPDVTGTTTATWGQVDDLPVTGTAVFDPDRAPAGSTPATVTGADWPFASIDYLDVNARTVNTAAFGAGAWQIGTSQYDSVGEQTWTLSPGNRAQALTTTADTDSYVAGKTSNVARAALLTSTTSYDPLSPGTVTDTYGPTHPITLSSGTVIHGRTHVATSYDEGAPNSGTNAVTGQPYGLATSTVTSALRVDATTATDTTGPDAQTTRTGYDPIDGSNVTGPTSGWTLGQATSSTVVMPGTADLVTKTRFDDNGRVLEQRLPNDTNGSGPRTTATKYYTATGSGSCVDPTRVGLVCSTGPAGQPPTGAPLPVTTYGYDQFGNQTSKTETYGTGSSQVVRTTTVGYDAAERPTTTAISVTPASAGGTALPAVTTAYAPNTGLPTTVSTTTGGTTTSLVTGYDNLGRTTTYTDATGNVSTTSYDPSGNLTTANNGQHTTTYTTDGTSTGEHRGMTTGEDIGIASAPSAFAATYDAAGNMRTETYPNGLVATRRYDNAGNLFNLTYAKDGTTWMTFTQDVNALGQIAHQTSPQSSQTFAYDPADRLAAVQDTYQNSCTTRTYNYDPHSNRTSLASSPAAGDRSCTTNTTATTTSYNYDDADRLTSDTAGNYTYDQLERATLVPAGDAESTGTRNTVTGNLTVGYYANDMVATQQQGTSSIALSLDPLQNRISKQVEGSNTTTNHYNDDSDSPAWAATGSTSTEYDTDPAGALAVTIQDGTAVLELANPHGDIVATCPDLANATATSSYSESTEFGVPRDAASTYGTYGWLGSEQRSANVLGGLTLMGVRLYDSSIGRFASVDPVPGGNANAYIYPDNPNNASDTSGQVACYRNSQTCRNYYHRARHDPKVLGADDLPTPDKCKGSFCFEPGKKGIRKERGRKVWKDRKGREWKQDPSNHRGPHWDVTWPGGRENVLPDGRVLTAAVAGAAAAVLLFFFVLAI